MRIMILCPPKSWGTHYAKKLAEQFQADGHSVRYQHEPTQEPGDLCFLLNWAQIVTPAFRDLFQHTLVVHADDLPKGRGWSPLTWRILEGQNRIVVSLIEAKDPVDSGVIYVQTVVDYDGTELLPELQQGIGEATVLLCSKFVEQFTAGAVNGRAQEGAPTYFKRRGPTDSRVDPERSIASQFNLLRVVDNDNYPAFFDFRGKRYVIRIERAD